MNDYKGAKKWYDEARHVYELKQGLNTLDPDEGEIFVEFTQVYCSQIEQGPSKYAPSFFQIGSRHPYHAKFSLN